jgi:hypothetical protein
VIHTAKHNIGSIQHGDLLQAGNERRQGKHIVIIETEHVITYQLRSVTCHVFSSPLDAPPFAVHQNGVQEIAVSLLHQAKLMRRKHAGSAAE